MQFSFVLNNCRLFFKSCDYFITDCKVCRQAFAMYPYVGCYRTHFWRSCLSSQINIIQIFCSQHSWSCL